VAFRHRSRDRKYPMTSARSVCWQPANQQSAKRKGEPTYLSVQPKIFKSLLLHFEYKTTYRAAAVNSSPFDS